MFDNISKAFAVIICGMTATFLGGLFLFIAYNILRSHFPTLPEFSYIETVGLYMGIRCFFPSKINAND